jgi:SAM-dependent methyltransferase
VPPENSDLLCGRMNMLHKSAEAWQPPVFARPGGPLSRFLAACRRFLDLQAGSIWRDLARILPRVRGTVLDVGCGAQPYRFLFARDIVYIGIDTADAKAHFGYDIPDTHYFSGDVWPIGDAAVDFILCAETLEHVPDPAAFLAQAWRCLAPGGSLVLTVPFAARWHFVPYDYWRFTPSGIGKLLSDAGFSGACVCARGNALTVACYKVMALILRLALPQRAAWPLRLCLQAASLPFLPLLGALALLANLSLCGQGGEDCLGYTAVARKKSNV